MSNPTFRETDIRPDHLMDGQADRFASDLRRLLEHKQEFVSVACPACGADSASPAFQKYELSYSVCSECQTMYVSPRPTPALLDDYYSKSENYSYWNKYIFPASEDTRREKIFRPRARRIIEICQRHRLNMGTVLEVGAGFGTFCEEIKRLEAFQEVIAVEPTPDLAQSCRNRGLEVIESPIEHVKLDGRTIDLIVSFEVIEHLFNPSQFMEKCWSLLPVGGLLVLTCPNVKGFDILTLGELSSAVDSEHLNYFHPSSLSMLLESKGFEVLEVQTPGQLDAELVRKSALAGEIDLQKQKFLQHVLIDEWDRLGRKFQAFLAVNQLSSHMWLASRKVESGGQS